jgi:hypothetical protein
MLVEYRADDGALFRPCPRGSKPTTSMSIEVLWRERQFEVIRIGTELEREVARLKTTTTGRDVQRSRGSTTDVLRPEALLASLRRLGCGSGAGPTDLLPLPTREQRSASHTVICGMRPRGRLRFVVQRSPIARRRFVLLEHNPSNLNRKIGLPAVARSSGEAPLRQGYGGQPPRGSCAEVGGAARI